MSLRSKNLLFKKTREQGQRSIQSRVLRLMLSVFSNVSAFLSYRHECCTGKYNAREIHTKVHPGLEWRVFHILTSEGINDFTDITFVS